MKQHEVSIWLRVMDAVSMASCITLVVIFAPYLASRLQEAQPQLVWVGFCAECLIVLLFLPLFGIGIIAWRIFSDIGKDESFSHRNALRLRLMSVFAFIAMMICLLGLIVIAWLCTNLWGAMIALALVMVASLALAVICAALSHLTMKAANIKDENDLTV